MSLDLRRDIGVWAALTGVAHTILGLQAHMGGDLARYFFFPGASPTLSRLRYDLFGLANYTGTVAALGLIMLLALSNNVSLRRLGRERWKLLQRATYPVAGLTALHAAGYQYLERRVLGLVIAFVALTALVAALQIAGARRRRAAPAARGEGPS